VGESRVWRTAQAVGLQYSLERQGLTMADDPPDVGGSLFWGN